MDTVRSIFKVILRSSNQVGINGPAHLKLPTIYDNPQLPKKLETNAIWNFIPFGKMSKNNFTGKFLIEHAAHLPIKFFTSSAEMLKLLDARRGCSILIDRIGDKKISKVGILVGALSKESRDDLASRITDLVWNQHGYKPAILKAAP